MDKLVKIAIVGLGAVAKKHISAILSFPNHLQLVAVVDSQADIVAEYERKLGVTGFNNLEAMLEKINVDIVVLCTPSGLHAQQALQCIDQGKQIVVEKPMALSLSEGVALQQVVQETKIKLWVVHQHRTNPILRLLKQIIDTRGFGQIYQVNLNVFWTRPQAYYDEALWRGSCGLDGGALMNQGSHYIDLLLWLLGPIHAIQAMWATQARQIETEDSCVMNIRWKEGFLGSFNLNILVYPKSLEASLTILGEKGTVKLTGLACNQITHWEFSDHSINREEIRQKNEEAARFIKESHHYYYMDLIKALSNKSTVLPDVTEGLKTLEVLVAAQQAAKHQITVNLPLSEESLRNFSRNYKRVSSL